MYEGRGYFSSWTILRGMHKRMSERPVNVEVAEQSIEELLAELLGEREEVKGAEADLRQAKKEERRAFSVANKAFARGYGEEAAGAEYVAAAEAREVAEEDLKQAKKDLLTDEEVEEILGGILGSLTDREVVEVLRDFGLSEEEIREIFHELTDEEVEAILGEEPEAKRVKRFEPDAANMPDREEVRRWLRENLEPGDALYVRGEPSQLRGRTANQLLDSLYKVLTKYEEAVHDYGEPIELELRSVLERVYPSEHGAGPFPVANSTTMLCFLKQAAARWPHLGQLCADLDAKWQDGQQVTAERIVEFIGRASSREYSNNTIGVELLDRARRVWWSHNVNKKNGERRQEKRILQLVAGCHHVEPLEAGEFNGTVVDLPHDIFRLSMEEGRWAQIVHEEAFLHQGTLFRDEAFVRELLEQGKSAKTGKGRLNFDFEEAYSRAPFCRSVQGVTAALFRGVCGVEGLEQGELRDYLDSTQVEHIAAEFQEVRLDDVEYDLNSCFASYRQCWYTDLYRRYGLPHIPSLGGWLPEDITEKEQDELLWQTGFALVEGVKIKHWSLEKFPYLVSGRAYPTVWLRHIKQHQAAKFRLRHIMLSGKFFEEGDLAGGDVMRKVIGKWQQRYVREQYYAGDQVEAERLAWGKLDYLKSFEVREGGYMLEFEAEAKVRYPHLRSYVLAYSHIALFHKLYQMATPPVAVKTDAVILRERDDEIFAPAWDIEPGQPGRWKIERDRRRGIRKMKDGEEMPLKNEGYGEARLREGRTRREKDQPKPPGTNEIGFLIRGDAEQGVEPICWETAWRFEPDPLREMPGQPTLETLVSGTHVVPLVISLRGAGGFGKTTWSAKYREQLTWDGRTAVSAYQHDTVEDLRGKFGGDVPGATLHAWLFPSDDRMRLEAAKVKSSRVVVVDEASQISADLFDRLGGKASLCLILAGDEAQTAPVDKTRKAAQYGPFRDRAGMSHQVVFTKDWRSRDTRTAALKENVRNLRLCDLGDVAQLRAMLDAGVEALDHVRQLEDLFRGKTPDDLAHNLLVICGKRATRDAVNDAIRKAAFGKRRPPDDALVPLRCCKTYRGGNAGARKVVPWREAKGLLGTKCWEWGYASTVHSVQGKTIEEPTKVVYVADWMCPGLVYTAVSRVQSLAQLVVVGAASYCEWNGDSVDDPDYNCAY